MTETAQPPTDPEGLRSEARLLRGTFRALREDLFTGAFAFRPLPPLADDSRVLRHIPAPLRSRARWAPQVAVVLAAAFVWLLGTASDGADSTAMALGLFFAVPVILTMFRPVAAFWLSMILMTLVAMGGTGDQVYPWAVGGFVSHLVVMTMVALRSRARVALDMWVLTIGYAVALSWGRAEDPGPTLAMAVLGALSLFAAVSVRGWTSAQREVVAKEEVTLVERSKRTLLEERTNIARELHDVVAHHMSVVAIQAEAAPYRVENPPPELAQAFATIRENAVAALTELRRVLGVVRAEDYEAPDAPQPTLADLDGLLANVRDTGLGVTKTVTGAVRELPPGVELSAYRIVQEALSNTLRHAPGASAKVEISYVLGGLGLRIVNGPPTGLVKPSPGAGHGVTGMRERVTMLNGEMTAEPLDDGGYEVAVFLPVSATTQGDQA
ncbi:sensor histidine kinase [Streptomyces sp. NBC_01304]|uniref:sensor histidine kinase n=1 Tax=Streptomyces sp. NBC_01304 TaxID=2903818 RepID=UPI002E0D72B5|nr:histidine kinase [Streptomyces sp. NBC_01304]